MFMRSTGPLRALPVARAQLHIVASAAALRAAFPAATSHCTEKKRLR